MFIKLKTVVPTITRKWKNNTAKVRAKNVNFTLTSTWNVTKTVYLPHYSSII